MNRFALDGGVLNGDPQVLMGDEVVALALGLDGSIANGIVGQGAFPLHLDTLGDLNMLAALEGTATIDSAASGVLMIGVTLIGQSDTVLTLQGDLIRWGMIVGQADVVVGLDGDIVVVPPISATFTVQLEGVLDLHIAKGQQIIGTLPVVLDGVLDGWVGHGLEIESPPGNIQIEVGQWGTANLIAQSAPAEFPTVLRLDGAGRLGAHPELSGYLPLSTHVQCELTVWHYVYASGELSIQLKLVDNAYGLPALPPDHYIEAPSIRILRVGAEHRGFLVPPDRRAL
jgi:hypothetical protein